MRVNVPRYYIQNFGSAVSHPDTNEYAAFLQDTIRVTSPLALSLGVRYDLQTFSTKGLVWNSLWPQAGKVPYNDRNFSPRVGLAHSIGNEKPLVIRAGYGLFYTRIPQVYTSTIATDNGLNSVNLILDNNDYFDRQLFPAYPNVLASCPIKSEFCAPPASVGSRLSADVASFAPDFKTPRVHQASLNIERELANRFAAGISYMYVHGQNLIRAGHQSAGADRCQLSRVRRVRRKLSEHVLRRPLFFHLADDTLVDLPLPALHQSIGTAEFRTGCNQPV